MLQEARCIYGTEKRVVGLSATLRNFTREKQIALLGFQANFKNKFINCGVRKGEAV